MARHRYRTLIAFLLSIYIFKVYATKTVFISQASPATTVFVSNGHIVTPFPPPNASPTPYLVNTGSNNTSNVVWLSPSGNPNIVVATVTAMSTAHRFVWDQGLPGWWITMGMMSLMICFSTFLGFGFVTFG
ncbi:uncharacterized protein VP01_1098g3 [Puccinia sorghi]|uniref:Uncharacterized protein n=1 Tax=Puccinia sorghi TaxID=27349 RepID=A0A0L6VT70_9BASI|nr:uncharacterized protein VP01_1098g3 [Puccinia sorghi]